MKVVVTGASSNLGARMIEGLVAHDGVHEVVGLTPGRPTWQPAKTRWVEGDVVSSPLEPLLEGAAAVIHLAWAVEPSRDVEALEEINILGSQRVFDAAAAAGVPKLVCASSAGAYAPAPTDELVGEDWPLGGAATSFYSLQKMAVETRLDEFEAQTPGTGIVRMRPALVFDRDAASEVRQLFAGPFLPSFLLREGRTPRIPRLAGICLQAVHTTDLARAYVLATMGSANGPFNIAARPPLDTDGVASALGAGTFRLSLSLARRLTNLSWRLHLQPTSPGWLDMAMAMPLISSQRAELELGWKPQFTATETLEELLAGLRETNGKSAKRSHHWADAPEQRLVRRLMDVHAIEEQALAQLREATELADDRRLAAIFASQLEEIEEQAQRVRNRIAAHPTAVSALMSPNGASDRVGLSVFTASWPGTPGELLARVLALEHLRIGTYGLLRESAEEADDETTAAMADRAVLSGRRAVERLEAGFDVAAAPLFDGDAGLARRLATAQATEREALRLLETAIGIVQDGELGELLTARLLEGEDHEAMVRERLEAHSAGPSKAGMPLDELLGGALFGAQLDGTARLAVFLVAFEHFEIAIFELLARVARHGDDTKVLGVTERILSEKRVAAAKLAALESQRK